MEGHGAQAGIGTRWALAALGLLAVLVVACGSEETSGGGAEPVAVDQLDSDAVGDGISALESITAEGLPDPLVDPAELLSGGPPPDGIPPIDDPRFLATSEVDHLADNEPVLAVRIGSDSRAYPVEVMIWHEIANDTFRPDGADGAAIPVAVTYCPLCNSAIAYDRRVDGRVLDFGTSGLLYRSALVMYDRQTESLWSHFNGRAVAGQLTGSELEKYPTATVSWKDWREANPDGLVLSRDTGETRPYGQNPYPGYDDVDESPFAFTGELDERLLAKERVLGTGIGESPTAVRLEALIERGVIAFEQDGVEVVAWALPGTASALETFEVADGRDVGATGLFRTGVDGRELSFTRTAEGFVDAQTGSSWNVLGEAIAGPLRGKALEPVEHVDTFWFAWAAFSPESRILP